LQFVDFVAEAIELRLLKAKFSFEKFLIAAAAATTAGRQ
jgi:hypothetical protein